MKRILVVEDEAPIREGIEMLLSAQSFEVTCVEDGEGALSLLLQEDFDLVLLDLMIPKLPGLTVLRRIRSAGKQLPVCVLTAKGSEDDIVEGLSAGADDYVTKPFGIKELVARVHGLLRRSRKETQSLWRGHEIEIDFDNLEIRSPAESVRLTARESDFISYLASHSHRAVSREDLLVDVWGYRDGTVRTRTVDVHVQQLRQKLSLLGIQQWIHTVRGKGYRFVAVPRS